MIVKTAPNVIQVTFKGNYTNNREMANVLHWQCASSIDATEANDMALSVVDAWQEEMLDAFPNNYVFVGADYIDLTSPSGVTGSVGPIPGNPTAGAVTAASLPPNTAVLVTKVLPARARNTRNGRMFLPPTDESGVDENGVFNPAGTQAIVDAFFARVEAFSVGTGVWTAVVPHWTDPPEDEEGETVLWPSVGVSAIGSLRVESTVATQRRRLRG